MTVLIVDDEYLHAELAQDVLARAGWTIVGIDSRTETAFTSIEKMRPDVVLLDLRFANEPTKGLDLAKKVRSNPKFHDPAPYFVFLTGHGSNEARKLIDELSCAMYLTKPIDERKLDTAIRVATERLGYIRDSQWALSQLEVNGFADRCGDYVAILNRKVIDDDDDRRLLKSRAAKAHDVPTSRIVIEYKGDDL